MGAERVFGVVHDGRRILSDEQEPYPGFLEAWREAREGGQPVHPPSYPVVS